MGATISSKKKRLATSFLKRTGGAIAGAAGAYISDVMPVVTSTFEETKATASEAATLFSSTAQSIMPKLKQIKGQGAFRSIINWFSQQEDEYSGEEDLSFDTPTDSAEIAEHQISEAKQNANQISKSVVESSHKMAEAQAIATANMVTAIDRQTKAITSGFDTTNKILKELLEVTTKNTATLIEATVAANNQDPTRGMLSKGKFDLSSYKKIIQKNLDSSELGMVKSFLPMLLDRGETGFLNFNNLVSMGFDMTMDKLVPNLKKNLSSLDSVISDTIMDSLVRLGEKSRDGGLMGALGSLFGIKGDRDIISTQRASLELKKAEFDTITKESITNAIPGYLRKILASLSGEDLIYDYRSRSFKSKGKIKREFMDATSSTNTLYSASNKVRNAIGDEDIMSDLYDKLINELGSRTDHDPRSNEHARKKLESFRDQSKARDYVKNNLLNNFDMTGEMEGLLEEFSRRLVRATQGSGVKDIMHQISMTNAQRHDSLQSYVDNADAYNIDLSSFSDSIEKTLNHLDKKIEKKYGVSRVSESQSSQDSGKKLSGVNYTNMALYEIYRRLNEGINVFKVGEANPLTDQKFEKFGDDYLTSPANHQAKPINGPSGGKGKKEGIKFKSTAEDPNLLENQTLGDGTTEELTGGERTARWGKERGKQLASAMFFGSEKDVKEAFGSVLRDVSLIGGKYLKKGAESLNTSFGNISGYLKHKMFGTEYEYQDGVDDDGNPIMKKVAENKKGGIFGFVKENMMDVFNKSKEGASKWFKSVASYFDFGSDKDGDEKGTAKKRKQILSASVGAMAGAGILGGPIGLLIGAVAGNALSAAGIGDKIKGLFFGRNEKGKPTGLVTRAVDGIIDPIKYQVGKTVNFIGGTLKKGLLGPLSDIGVAIKERITSAASSKFGKLFSLIGKALLLPFKAVTKVASAPITAIGAIFRRTAAMAGGVTGGFLNATARFIGRKGVHVNEDGTEISTGEYLKQRRKARKEEVKNERKNSKFNNYKDYKRATDQERGARMAQLSSYISEDVSEVKEDTSQIADTMEEVHETIKDQAERQAEINEQASDVYDHMLDIGSIYTHDQGVHDRLDTIIKLMGGEVPSSVADKDRPSGAKVSLSKEGLQGTTGPDNPKESSNKDVVEAIKESAERTERASYNTSAISAASSMASGDETISNDEGKIYTKIIDDSEKPKTQKATIGSKLKNLMGIQKKKKDDDGGEKKEKNGILSRILGTVTDVGSGLLGGITGILGKFTPLIGAVTAIAGVADLKSFWNNVVKGDKTISEWWGEDSYIGKGVKGLMQVSGFVGDSLGWVVDLGSSVIETVSGWIPGIPKISIPRVADCGPFKGLATAILGGMYLKGISAIASVAGVIKSAVSTAGDTIGNIGGKIFGKGGTKNTTFGKWAARGATALAVYDVVDSFANPITHENTDANGNEIVDQDLTRANRKRAIKGAKDMYDTAQDFKAVERGKEAARQAQKHGQDANEAFKKATERAGRKDSKMVKNAAEELAEKGIDKLDDDPGLIDKALGFIKKGLEAVKNFLMKNDSVKKVAGAAEKVAGKLDDLLKTATKTGKKFLESVAEKVGKIIAKGLGKDAVKVGTAGIGAAVMGIYGAIEGASEAAQIFCVRECDVTAGMRTVAAIIVALLEAVPFIWALELLDLIIAPYTIRGILCELLYTLLCGGDTEELQKARQEFERNRNNYNDKYGANLSNDEFNDMVNNGMWDKAWEGGAKTDENGDYVFDDAGEAIFDGGVKSLFSGAEKQYVKDENGNVIRDKDGKAIQAVDKDGHTLKKDAKWGDHLADGFGDAVNFFTGHEVYKTDENGVALVDENGNPIVDHYEKGIFAKAGDAIGDAASWVGDKVGGFFKGAKSFFGFGDDEEEKKKKDREKRRKKREEKEEKFKSNLNDAGMARWDEIEKQQLEIGFDIFNKESRAKYDELENEKWALDKNPNYTKDGSVQPDGATLDTEGTAVTKGGSILSSFLGDVKENGLMNTLSTNFQKGLDKVTSFFGFGDDDKDEDGETGIFGKLKKGISNIGTSLKAGINEIGKNLGLIEDKENANGEANGEAGGPLSFVSNAVGKLSSVMLGPAKVIYDNVKDAVGGNSTDKEKENEKVLDEDGNPILDENGKPINPATIGDTTKNMMNNISGAAGGLMSSVTGVIKDWTTYEYEVDENGQPLLDENGNKIKKGNLKNTMITGLQSVNNLILSPFKELADGTEEWTKNAPWKKDGANSMSEWISNKMDGTFSAINGAIGDTTAVGTASVDTATTGDTITDTTDDGSTDNGNSGDEDGDKSSTDNGSSTSSTTTPSTSGTDAKNTSAPAATPSAATPSNNKNTTTPSNNTQKSNSNDSQDLGGAWYKGEFYSWSDLSKKFNIGRDGRMGDDGPVVVSFTKPTVKKGTTTRTLTPEEYHESVIADLDKFYGGPSSEDEAKLIGGNPLSKSARITSGYGDRPSMGGFHHGVDLTPDDNSTRADVKSQFDGTVVAVKRDVSDSDTGHPYTGSNSTGNAVVIQTADGRLIKNYHLKAGSIPSNIKKGSPVKKGQFIGGMGSTGHSTGPHLHYQIEESANINRASSSINPFTGNIRVNPNSKYRVGDGSININKKTGSKNTTSSPGRSIKYIVIHYTADPNSKSGKAANVASFFGGSAKASADFIVDDANIVQYNPDPKNNYCHHCGGNKYSNTKGAAYYNKCTNNNSIGIEICSSNKTGGTSSPAYSDDWYFTDAVIANAVKLTKYLMQQYKIPASNVIRHWDVTGKPCPGIKGWTADSGDESKWNAFKASIGGGGTISASASGGGAPSAEQQKWISTILDVKKQIAANGKGYVYGGNTETITSNGYTRTFRTDCSGFVSICLSCFAGKDIAVSSSDLIKDNKGLEECGFTRMDWPGWESLISGDIVAKDGHTEIFCKNEGGKHLVWNCGSDSSCNSADPCGSANPQYSSVWRLNGAVDFSGAGVNNDSGVSNQGPLAQLMGLISDAGNKFLSSVTGGLIGNTGNTSNPTAVSGLLADDGTAVASGNQTARKGDVITPPSGLGTANTFMGWQCITSPDSAQYKLREQAGQKFDENGYGKINGRYTIAMTTTYGTVGDYVDVERADGTTLKGIIADIKNQNDEGCNQWGHQDGKVITEFVVDKAKWYDPSGGKNHPGGKIQSTTTPGKNKGAVTKVTNQGSYFSGDSAGGPTPEDETRLLGSAISGDPTSEEDETWLPEPMGGPVPSSRASIGRPRYVRRAPSTHVVRKRVGGPSTASPNVNATGNILTSIDPFTEIAELPESIQTKRGSTDLSGVMNALYQIVSELKSIASNTGSSTELLNSINEKDFVDKGLRDSINSLSSGSSSRKTPYRPGISGAKMVASMARP